MTSQPPSDFKRSLWEKLISIEIKEFIIGLSIGLAFLSLFLTLNSDVFEQDDERLMAIFTKPLVRLCPVCSSTNSTIDLSSLLTPKPGSGVVSGQQGNTAKSENLPLYIFAIDVSRSMTEQIVSKEELEQYFLDIKNPEINPDQGAIGFPFLPEHAAVCNTFDIARAELWRFLYSIPEKSQVALYQFGRDVQRLAPGKNTDDIYLTFDTTGGGGHPRNQVLGLIPPLTANQDQTNFEKLLYELSLTYKKEINRRPEVHFILISDFAHDIGGEYLRNMAQSDRVGIDQTEWESKYRISSIRIAGMLREMAKRGNTTFHLAEVIGSRRAICNIVPIVGDTLEIFRYRESHLIPSRVGKEFDFLRSYQESATPLIFYYTHGSSQSLDTRINIDQEKYANSAIRLALATEANVHQVFPLKIDVNFGNKPKKDVDPDSVLRPDNGGYNGKIERKGDWLSLHSHSTLQPREAATYRLLISWTDSSDATSEGVRVKTFTVPILFYPQLSLLSALSIFVSEMIVLFFGIGLIMKVINQIRLRKRKRVTIPSAKAMAAGAEGYAYDPPADAVPIVPPKEQ